MDTFQTERKSIKVSPSGHISLYNVVLTSIQHHDVAPTLVRRYVKSLRCLDVNATFYQRHDVTST